MRRIPLKGVGITIRSCLDRSGGGGGGEVDWRVWCHVARVGGREGERVAVSDRVMGFGSVRFEI